MLISVIRKGRASVSGIYIYMHLRESTRLTYIVAPHCRVRCVNRRSLGFPRALSSTEHELEHSARWPGCSALTMVGCVQSEGHAFIGRVFCYAWIIWRIRWNITEMNGRLVELTWFAEINHFYIYWTLSGRLQFNQHSFIVIFGGLKTSEYYLLNM